MGYIGNRVKWRRFETLRKKSTVEASKEITQAYGRAGAGGNASHNDDKKKGKILYLVEAYCIFCRNKTDPILYSATFDSVGLLIPKNYILHDILHVNNLKNNSIPCQKALAIKLFIVLI